MSTVNPLSMSDEDFLNQNGPTEVVQEAQADAGGETTTEVAEVVVAPDAPTLTQETTESAETTKVDETQQEVAGDLPTAVVVGAVAGTKEETTSSLGSVDAAALTSAQEAPDYEAMYKSIVAPIKANGKTINVQSTEEAIQLMQMGANYTRKMQALAPQRKMLMMLENNGMLDEAQLSFAIDLVKNRSPEAIKKLLKEAGIDPMDIDTATDANYREGNHRVSDDEAGFVTALEDLRSTQEGADTIRVINSEWDQASKDALWKSPEVMSVINEQRASGVYARVADEVERQRTLGAIPANMPFIHAYRQIGDQLGKAGQLDDLVRAQAKPQIKAPVATRAAAPKPAVVNSAKASAASATRSTPVTAAAKTNPLALSDEAFMKQFNH